MSMYGMFQACAIGKVQNKKQKDNTTDFNKLMVMHTLVKQYLYQADL